MKTEIKAGDEVRISKSTKVMHVYDGYTLLEGMKFSGYKEVQEADSDETFLVENLWYSRKMLVPKRTRK